MGIRAKAFYRLFATALFGAIVAPQFAMAAGPTGVQPSVWWKSDAGVTSAGGLVSSWADQSGNGNNAVNATVGQQPSLIPNAVGSFPALRFDGADDSLVSPTGALLGNTPHTIFLVSKYSGVTSAFAGGAVLYSGSAADSQNSTLGAQKDGRLWVGGYAEDDVPYNNAAPSPTSNVGTTQFRLTEKVYNNGSYKGYLDGANVVTGAGKIYNLTSTETGVGKQFDGGTWYGGDIAEVIIYNSALSDVDRGGVEAYIAAKYLPEPSIIGLGLVGGFGVLMRRRRTA